MNTRTLGRAELYGRLIRVINHHGTQRRTPPRNAPAPPSFLADTDGSASLHSHVLRDLGITAGVASTGHDGGVQFAYPAAGVALTDKALRLAQLSEEFEEKCAWGDAVETAGRLAQQLEDTSDDLYLDEVALLAVMRHVADKQPADMTPLPGWLPSDTPLFINGYPTTLLGHVAAELHVNAATASYLGENDAIELFRALDWKLTPRAEALTVIAQDSESNWRSWPDAVTAAESAVLDHVEPQA